MPDRDPVDTAAPWTIKSVSVATREIVTAAARREGLTVGQWLERRVAEWEREGSPTQVIPSGQPGQSLTRFAPVQLSGETGKLDLAGLADALRAVATVAGAAEMPVPKSLAREASALLRQQIREAQGKA